MYHRSLGGDQTALAALDFWRTTQSRYDHGRSTRCAPHDHSVIRTTSAVITALAPVTSLNP